MEPIHDSKTLEKKGRNKNMRLNKALTTIDPIREFNALLPQTLFESFFQDHYKQVMRTDYFIEDGNITINVDVAGATSEDVTVNLSKSQKCVVVKLAKQYEKKDSKPHFYIRERMISEQRRIFALPEEFDYESMDASVKNGLLTIKGKLMTKPSNEANIIIKVKSED